jgi:hypothetical protein
MNADDGVARVELDPRFRKPQWFPAGQELLFLPRASGGTVVDRSHDVDGRHIVVVRHIAGDGMLRRWAGEVMLEEVDAVVGALRRFQREIAWETALRTFVRNNRIPPKQFLIRKR